MALTVALRGLIRRNMLEWRVDGTERRVERGLQIAIEATQVRTASEREGASLFHLRVGAYAPSSSYEIDNHSMSEILWACGLPWCLISPITALQAKSITLHGRICLPLRDGGRDLLGSTGLLLASRHIIHK